MRPRRATNVPAVVAAMRATADIAVRRGRAWRSSRPVIAVKVPLAPTSLGAAKANPSAIRSAPARIPRIAPMAVAAIARSTAVVVAAVAAVAAVASAPKANRA